MERRASLTREGRAPSSGGRMGRMEGRRPGRLYIEPAPLLATCLLLLNDHVMKARWPNMVTGKLSDLAGLFFVPLLALALVEVAMAALGQPWATTQKRMRVALVLAGLGFAAVKLLPWAAEIYGYALGSIRWPAHTAASLINGGGVATVSPAVVLADRTDLIALPMLWLSWWSGRRWTVQAPTRRTGTLSSPCT